MTAPFQYLTSFVDCISLPPNQVCLHYSTYPTLLQTMYWALHRIFLAPETLGYTEWAFIAIFAACVFFVGYCIYNITTRAKTERRGRVGGSWGAIDNLCGYVLGYDTQGEHKRYPYDNEEDQWLERMM